MDWSYRILILLARWRTMVSTLKLEEQVHFIPYKRIEFKESNKVIFMDEDITFI